MNEETAQRIAEALERIANAVESRPGEESVEKGLNICDHLDSIAESLVDLSEKGIETFSND